jgi:ribosomal protein S18 acetylase RimI-like enzyme
VNEAANRRCYEKAGYADTGERREQSGGAITLAYMEKIIPAFRDMKNQFDNPDIIKLLSYSVYECSLERAALKAQSYKRSKTGGLYGWVENGDILGVCGFFIHPNKVEINSISVAENARKRGVSRAMITALREKYRILIEAETDDDAVDFYRKCGFETAAIFKQYGDEKIRRWNCKLPFPNYIAKGLN